MPGLMAGNRRSATDGFGEMVSGWRTSPDRVQPATSRPHAEWHAHRKGDQPPHLVLEQGFPCAPLEPKKGRLEGWGA